jgi:hypothetical protein
MKPPIVLLALSAALAAASVASAADSRPPGVRPTAGCRGKVAVILRGTYLSADTTSFSMLVRTASRNARALRGRRKITVGEQTRFRRNGKRATLPDLRAGDRLLVYARGCRRGQANRLELLAKSVFAHGEGEKTVAGAHISAN